MSPRLSSDLSPRRCKRGEPSDHQKHGDFPCRKSFFRDRWVRGKPISFPIKKTGSPRIEKLVSTYKKCWIWGGWWWMYLRAKIEKEKLACVDMNMDNMVWHVYGTWFPHRKELKWSMMVCYLHCRSRRIGLQILHRVGLEEGIMVVAAGRRYFLANVWVFFVLIFSRWMGHAIYGTIQGPWASISPS